MSPLRKQMDEDLVVRGAPRRICLLLVLPPRGSARSLFKFQTPSH